MRVRETRRRCVRLVVRVGGGGGGLVECRVGVGHCRGQRPGEARGLGCTRDNGCVSGQLTIIWCREGGNFIIWAQVKEEE